MATVTLSNPGLIPIEAVTTMGVSAKEGENPIGFFGTGLKYAVAALLRTSQKVTIWRGLVRHDFETFTDLVRGKEFQFINMREDGGDPVRLGFTTHLGGHWETWQVFRELYSNCLDEAGEVAFEETPPREDHTTIWVVGEAFAAAARDRDRYFLSSEPIHKGALVSVHAGAGDGIYYRGVLVGKLPKAGVHTYNVTTSMTLTEDRTLKDMWSVGAYVAHDLARCTDRAVIDKVLSAVDRYEAGLAYFGLSEAFAERALALCEKYGTASVIQSAVNAAETWAQREARVKPALLTARECEEVEEAKAFLARIGYVVEAPIVVAETLGADVFGMARNDTIYIARITLTRGGNFLVGTILEEHLHFTHGFLDESRRFQDFLIDLVVKFARDCQYQPRAAFPSESPAPAKAPALELEEMPF